MSVIKFPKFPAPGSLFQHRVIAVLFAVAFLGCQPRSQEGPAPCTDQKAGPVEGPSGSGLQAALATVTGQLSVVDERGTRTRELAQLVAALKPRLVQTQDPYYRSHKQFFGISLVDLLQALWPDLATGGTTAEIQFESSDGYKVRLNEKQAFDANAYLAFFDVGHPKFEPIGERKADPAPLYLIWEGAEFMQLQTHPRPWGIVRIRLMKNGEGLERLRPALGFAGDAKADLGYELFIRDCLHCHGINQQGGKLGPDLNVPQNILEYRPEEQVRAYIKNPLTFRYGSMPAHPQLTNADLDGLMSYLKVMQQHKAPHSVNK